MMRTNNRFLVFRGDDYYPHGGWADYIGSADEIRDAVHIAIDDLDKDSRSPMTGDGEWYHVVDIWSSKIVCEGEFSYRTIAVETNLSLDYERQNARVQGLSIKVLCKVTCVDGK